jgi:Ribosomal protein L15
MTNDQIVILLFIIVVCCVFIGWLGFFFYSRFKSKSLQKPKHEEVAPKVKGPRSLPTKPKKSVEEKPISNLEFVKEEDVTETIIEEEHDDFNEEEETEKVVQVVNGRRIFVQFNYSFKAKLILASPEVQEQYRTLVNFVHSYGAKTSLSWKQERIYLGRNTFALLLFKGKKLCVAYALDPKEYEGSKYHLIDLSEVKRFEKTQALLKLTSDRKFKYAQELLDLILTNNELTKKDMEPLALDLPKLTKDELIEEKLIKVYSSDEITEGAVLQQAKVTDIIRKNVNVTEANHLISTDQVMEYVEVETNQSKVSHFKKDIINIDTLAQNFGPDELVNLEALKEKKLISSKVDHIKVLARGILDKPLIIEAQDFSIDAIKMIVLTGGQVRKVN